MTIYIGIATGLLWQLKINIVTSTDDSKTASPVAKMRWWQNDWHTRLDILILQSGWMQLS